jgi:plastocyanin
MSNKLVSIIVVVVLIAIGVFLFMGRSVAPTQTENTNVESVEQSNSEADANTEEASTVKEFTVDASNFAFSLKDITVKEGDTVKITFKNTVGFHDFRLDEFNVATSVLQAGQSTSVEFVANKKGSFEYYCSVGTHRAQGMVGTLTVE